MPSSETSNPASVLEPQAHSAIFGRVRLHCAYQPIFRMDNNKLVPFAVEALARPFSGGLPIAPSHFLEELSAQESDIAERTLRQLHIRNSKSLPSSLRRIFLNLNPAQFQDRARLVAELDDLGRELTAVDLTPRNIVIEITEQQADRETISLLTYELRARGYLVAIDDFGAQSSTMVRVKQMAPDIVKLDGELVRNAMRSPNAFAQIIDLVEELDDAGISVLMEGLENSQQVELAIKSGAAYFQGYGLCIPQIAPIDIDEWKVQSDIGAAQPLSLRAKHFG